MAFTTSSTYMLLPVPQVGIDPGPQWATDVNSCLTIIDQHDHTPGSGIQITPSGLNINNDLTFSNNNATNVRSIRLFPQASALVGATDIGCVYAILGDLYYNNSSGVPVQITNGGSIAGASGNITGLVPPASASYVAVGTTFVWQSAAATAANMDARNYILRNASASSFGLTLSPPTAMGADYTVTLPSLPASTKMVTMDASGALAAAYSVDGTTIVINTNVLSVGNISSGLTGVLPVVNGGTGLSSFVAGEVFFADGTGAVGQSTGLFWDNADSRLGIGTVAPGQPLTVAGGARIGDSSNMAGTDGALTVRRAAGDSVPYLTLIDEGSVNHTIASGGTGRRNDLVFSNDAVGDYIFATASVRANNIFISGSITQDSKNAVVSNTNAASPHAVLRGGVNATGASGFLGEGFTVAHTNGTGTYVVTFTTPFASSPAVTATLFGASGASIIDFIVVSAVTSSTATFIVNSYNTSTLTYGALDRAFLFTAIGPRT